jgi:hypothetical protein
VGGCAAVVVLAVDCEGAGAETGGCTDASGPDGGRGAVPRIGDGEVARDRDLPKNWEKLWLSFLRSSPSF